MNNFTATYTKENESVKRKWKEHVGVARNVFQVNDGGYPESEKGDEFQGKVC